MELSRRCCRRVLLYMLPFFALLILAIGSRNRFASFLPTCTPVTKIGFLKTHKCASSTIQNILFRFGDSRGLNFVLPLYGNYLGRSQHFNRSMVEKAPWHHLGYDIFAVHTMWNTAEVRTVLGADATLISILRDPVDLFESLYSFAQWDRLFRMDIHRFARAINFNTNRSLDFLSVGGYTGHNQMFHDFGLPERNTSNIQMISSKINEIERDFSLIMMAEYMEDSLILLRHLLCWELEDVTSLPLNRRYDFFRRNLETETRELLRQWLWADQMLYDHFLSIFKKKRNEFGLRRLALEVEQLKNLNSELREMCEAKETNYKNLKGNFRPSSSRVHGFSVANKLECSKLATSELAYIDVLRVIQFERANNTTP